MPYLRQRNNGNSFQCGRRTFSMRSLRLRFRKRQIPHPPLDIHARRIQCRAEKKNIVGAKNQYLPEKKSSSECAPHRIKNTRFFLRLAHEKKRSGTKVPPRFLCIEFARDKTFRGFAAVIWRAVRKVCLAVRKEPRGGRALRAPSRRCRYI